MARNRQRAKQRQADRRAARIAEQGGVPAAGDGSAAPVGDPPAPSDPAAVEPSPAVPPELAVGAPPENEGRSDTVMRDEPALDGDPPRDEEEARQQIEDWEVADEGGADDEAAVGAGESGYEARGRSGREQAARHKDRPRVIQFLIASWAELQRVQWPNRQALTTLTGVVLGFVLIAGGYLGLLDLIFSKLIKAII